MGFGDWNPFKKASIATDLLTSEEKDPKDLLEVLPGDLPSKTEDVNEMMTIIANLGGVGALTWLNKKFPNSSVVELADHLAYNIASQSDSPFRTQEQTKRALSDWLDKKYYYDDWEKGKGTVYSGVYHYDEHGVYRGTDYGSPNIVAQYLGLEDINYPLVSGPSKELAEYVGNLSEEQLKAPWYSMEQYRNVDEDYVQKFIDIGLGTDVNNKKAIQYDLNTLKETGYLNISNYYIDRERKDALGRRFAMGDTGLLELRNFYETEANLANYTTVLEYDKETGKGIIHAYDIWDFGSSYSDEWLAGGDTLQEQFMTAVGTPINFYDRIEIPKEQMDAIFKAGEPDWEPGEHIQKEDM